MGYQLVTLIARWNIVMGFISAMALATLPALGRDVDGRYKDSPLHEWFDHLASRNGLCCSYADGYVIEDADWVSQADHYRVRVPTAAGSKDMVWIDVPDEAVITEPNKVGRTMVWPLYGGFEAYRFVALCPGAWLDGYIVPRGEIRALFCVMKRQHGLVFAAVALVS